MEIAEFVDGSIDSSSQRREEFFEELYKQAFPNVARMVAGLGGSQQDAKDIFHDALVIYYEKSQTNTFHINVSPVAYVVGISKHLWIKKFNRNRSSISLENWEQCITIPEEEDESMVEDTKILALLERAGRKCMDLLKAFYYDALKLHQIRKAFNYSSEHSVSVQKFKCLEKVRDVVKYKTLRYDDFT